MIGQINIRERGAVPRALRRVWRAASTTAWDATGNWFDANLRDLRFTPEHALKAGYYKRKGEGMPVGSKAWKSSYTGRKFKRFGHTNPLENSGKTREALRAGGRIVSFSDKVRVRYPQARVFNFRNPKSRIDMQDEFRRILPDESTQLARIYDGRLDIELKDANWQSQAVIQ